MADLFSPLAIKGMTIKNRLVLSPLNTSYAARNGVTTERLIRYYEERAKGGVGLIITETSCVAWEGRNSTRGLGICEDYHIEGLRKLTERIHQYDTKIAIQLLHRGRVANPDVTHLPVKVVSWVPGYTPFDESSILSENEIRAIIGQYADAAVRAKSAGFDAVELHGAHGYLITQFLSPLTNRRTDYWGGTPEKRMNFVLEVLKSVRNAVGQDFPIGIRLNSIEGVSGGMVLEDTKKIALAVVDAGIDWVHISAGIPEADIDIPLSHMRHGWNVENVSSIRKAIERRVPVIAVGRLGVPDLARTLIADDKADLVALGRPLLADPYLPQKMKEGRESEILPCVSCNEGCAGRTRKGLEVRCAFNPRTGFECIYPYEVDEAALKHKIIVVGGGLGGMQAALTAAERGHSVTLFEKNRQLGGLCIPASAPPYKEELQGIINWYERRLREMPNVNLRLGEEANTKKIQALAPDYVIIAAGSRPIVPGIFNNNHKVCTAEEVLTGRWAPGKKVLILGGGLVGCETAEFLADKGSQVFIAELQKEVASDMNPGNRRWLLDRLISRGVTILTETEVTEISSDGSVRMKTPGGERTLEGFDQFVAAVGYLPDKSLCRELENTQISWRAVGDCSKVGKMMDAIHGAFELAQTL